MKLGKILLAIFAGVTLTSAAMAAKPGTTTVPLHTVKMVDETVSMGTLADAGLRERTIRNIRVIRSERSARSERTHRSERFERRHERTARSERFERRRERTARSERFERRHERREHRHERTHRINS